MKNFISDTSSVHNLKTTTKLFKESLDDFFKLFDSSPSAMAITDVRRLKFVKVNEKFVEFFGYKKEEVIGRTAIDISIHDKTEFNRILNFLKENQGFQIQIFCACEAKTYCEWRFPSKERSGTGPIVW